MLNWSEKTSVEIFTDSLDFDDICHIALSCDVYYKLWGWGNELVLLVEKGVENLVDSLCADWQAWLQTCQ